MYLVKVATYYRALYLYAVHAHQCAAKVSFFQDHEFFAEVYESAQSNYDACAERYMGINQTEIPSLEISKKAVDMIGSLKLEASENADFYKEIYKQIQTILKLLEESKNNGSSLGVQDLIAGQANSLEVLCYKIYRRTK